MMKKIIILLPFLLLAFSSCSRYSYINLLHIKQGMNSNEVAEVVSSFFKPSIDVFLIDDASSDMYDISSKIKAKVKTTILIAEKKVLFKTPYYIFAFEDDKLIYWGLPIDFKRSSNAKFVKIGTEAVRIIHRDYLDD